jgi:hypothetical protein
MISADFALLTFKNNYIVPNFNYVLLCCVTISTSSRCVFMVGFMERNKADDGDSYHLQLQFADCSL